MRSKTNSDFRSESMKLTVKHRTVYRYSPPSRSGLTKIRKTPKSEPGQEVIRWNTTVSGGTVQARYRDQYRNITELIAHDPDLEELEIVSEGEVMTRNTCGMVGETDGFAPMWLFLKPTKLTSPGAGVAEIADSVRGSLSDPVAAMHELSAAIAKRVRYGKGRTDARATVEFAIAAGQGVCQDHAHIFIAAARCLGVPARYVSGYMRMADGSQLEASHAWAEAHLDGLGWLGLDVSNGVSPDENYIRMAVGRDYDDAAPVKGFSQGAGSEEMVVSLSIDV